MRVKETDEGINYFYKGDLQKEVNKCFAELLKKESQVFLIDSIYERAKKERDSLHNRIKNLKQFMELAKERENIVPEKKG
ncbi:hypothetical protein [Streptococcus ferus]|uniref:hypothetical protein n=1 Tax=Streptococcus ferus TaxID=1345 RepID=UPI0023579BCC|nr:hypothetical protein [Streptococcus ferus]